MSMNPGTGTSTTRRMREGFSSRSGLGTARVDLIRRYTQSPPRALRSRCVVRGSSFSSVAEHGETTGLQRRVSAALGEWERANLTDMEWNW